MKNKYILIIISVICCLLFSSFSKNNTVTITGYIRIYGNDPFGTVGIETMDGKIYAVSASDEEIKEIWKAQSKKIEITGIIIKAEKDKMPGMLKDGKIELAEWRVLK